MAATSCGAPSICRLERVRYHHSRPLLQAELARLVELNEWNARAGLTALELADLVSSDPRDRRRPAGPQAPGAGRAIAAMAICLCIVLAAAAIGAAIAS